MAARCFFSETQRGKIYIKYLKWYINNGTPEY